MNTKSFTRRTFLQTSLAAGGALLLPRFSFAQGQSPNGKIQIAGIGVGNKGNRLIQQFAREDLGQVVAICDTDKGLLQRCAENVPDAKAFQDFRELFDAMGDQIDAVVIATPDHSHTYLTHYAMTRGKHVYCEKPLTRTIGEARFLKKLAEENPELATQMGNQTHSGESHATWRDMYLSGMLGSVTEVHCWCENSQSTRYFQRPGSIPPEATPVPEDLAYDLWLGPAEERPFNKTFHPRTWRGWWHFGTGLMGDVGVHLITAPLYAMDLEMPTKVEVEGSEFSPEFMPKDGIIHFTMKSPHQTEPLIIHWYDNPADVPRPADLEEGRNLPGTGLYAVGTEMSVLGQGFSAAPVIFPEEKRRAAGKPEAKAPRLGSHYGSWLEACKDPTRELASPFPLAARFTEAPLVGALAQRAGKAITWDAQSMSVPGMPELDPWISPMYREGWQLPA